MRLKESDRQAYEKHQDDLHHQASVVKSNYDAGAIEGRDQGRKEGIEQGIEQGSIQKNKDNASAMKKAGVAHSVIHDVTRLLLPEIEALN